MNTISNGANKLAQGANKLFTGANKLVQVANKLVQGANKTQIKRFKEKSSFCSKLNRNCLFPFRTEIIVTNKMPLTGLEPAT